MTASLLLSVAVSLSPSFFFFTGPAPTGIYTLSLHDALPIFRGLLDADRALDLGGVAADVAAGAVEDRDIGRDIDRKSTRLNSSHVESSYAGFCLKKKTPVRARAGQFVTSVDRTGRPCGQARR